MNTYALWHKKGGVGKTTMSVNLADCSAAMGDKTLLIDICDQNNSSKFLGVKVPTVDYNKPQNDTKTLYHVLDKRFGYPVKDAIQSNVRANLDLIQISKASFLEAVLLTEKRIDLFLKELIYEDLIKMGYVRIFIDCGPSDKLITEAALHFVDKIIIPVQLESPSVDGIKQVYEYLDFARVSRSKLAFIVPTLFDARTNSSKNNLEILNIIYGDDPNVTITDYIPRRTAISDAVELGKTVAEYDHKKSIFFEKVFAKVVMSE